MSSILSLRGRMRRRDFGFFWLGVMAFLVTIFFLADQVRLPAVFIMLTGMGVIVTGLLQCIKRLHDMDFTGWYALLLLIPLANFALWLMLFFKEGTFGPNSYGDDPKILM
jgi:uncharacterized membrane protein YhaH (DUF805 family)